MTAARVRVAVYVTRERNGHSEVLVVDHDGADAAGTRIPAGGVDGDERLDVAARREVEHETGVSLTGIGAPLAVQQRPQRGTGVPRVTVFFHATTDEARDTWTHEAADRGPRSACSFTPVTGARALLGDHQGEFVDLIPTLVSPRS
jgi:ADP-ribose pyrophosphatase YjhB (NUDIX family)